MRLFRIRWPFVVVGMMLLAGGYSPHDMSTSLAGDADEISAPIVAPAEPPEAKPVAELALASKPELPTVAWQDVDPLMGQEVFVVGTVVTTGKSKNGHVFLNFSNRRGDLTGFIQRSVVEKFEKPPEKQFRGRRVQLRGELYRHRGQPNIRITDPSHVRLLPDDSPLPKRTAKRIVKRAAPIRRVSDVVTIASYNVLNLFDQVDDPYRNDEGTPAKRPDQIKALVASIRHLDADILVLSEVETRGYLEQFNDRFLADLGYRHVVHFEGNDGRGIDVALLSRLPIGPVTSYRHLTFPDANGRPMRLRRDLLQVRIEPKVGLPFEILAVHLKSKHGEDKGAATRLGEARMIRRVMDQILQDDAKAPFVLCGDFNDTIDSPPIREILGKGSAALVPLFGDLPHDARVTYNREPYRDMIDFVFASPAMARRYVDGSYAILPGSPKKTGSDHNPVSARFRLR